MNKKKTKVFISYVHEDYGVAKKIYSFLSDNNCDVWIDKISLRPGEKWENVIEKAICDADYFVSLQSCVSVEKTGTFQKEQRIAIEKMKTLPPNKIFIIPIRIDECMIGHSEIRKLQWLEMFANGFDETMQEILEKIKPIQFIKTYSSKSVKDNIQFQDCVIEARDSGRIYKIEKKIYNDELFEYYLGTMLSDQGKTRSITLKVVKESTDNGLLQNEYATIKGLRQEKEEDSKQIIFLRKVFLPKPYDRIRFSIESAKKLRGCEAIVFRKHPDAINLCDLRKRFPYGMPERHMGWIIERFLLVLGFIHDQGLILGNINPANSWVLDKDSDEVAHNRAFFSDFSLCLQKDGNENYKIRNDYSAPEVGTTSSPHVSSDMYSLGLCLAYISNGDMNSEFRDFIRNLCQKRSENRPISAWDELKRFKAIRERYFTINQPIFFNQQ